MKNRIGLVAGALASITMAAACTGGGGDGGGSGSLTFRAGDVGGFVFIAAGDAGAQGGGAFYSGVATGDPNETVTIEYGTDDCVIPEADTGTAGDITFNYLDVGASLTGVSGAFTLTMAKDTSDGIQYSGFQPGAAPANADWTVSNSGSGAVPAGTIATVHVPTAVVDGGNGDIVSGSAQEITWTGGESANIFSINVSDSNGDVVYECSPANDGSFTLPIEVTTAAGAGGTYDLNALEYRTSTFQGKTLVLVGVGF